ncbi:prolyl oligopeptidase family serine peptidase [Glaciecola siphonariae]|uniref:Prolyl oligopeptidase family serine peptidase n=1 Tax=Glaciecola siphonariae TaxID=521012 RepID=A0ABV9LUD0_9ALTE
MKTTKLSAIVLAIALASGCTATQSNSDSAAPRNTASTSSNFPTATVTQEKNVALVTSANSGEQASLTLEQIMADPDWLGRQPERVAFAPGSNAIVYRQKQEGSILRDVFVTQADAASGEGNGTKVPLSQLHEMTYSQYIDDIDYDFVAWIYEGDVFAKKRGQQNSIQLTRDSAQARNLSYYKNDGVSFQVGNSFYSISANGDNYQQIMEWDFSEAPQAVKPAADYLAQEQLKLIEYVNVDRKNRQDREALAHAIKRENDAVMSAQFYFDKEHTNVTASLSPNGKYAIVVTRENRATRDDSDIMPDYIEESGRIVAKPVRQRVADAKPISHDIYLLDIEANTQRKISYVNLPGYNEDVLEAEKRENAEARGEKYVANRLPRDIGLLFGGYATEAPIAWHEDGQVAALMLEAWDNKDRWIVTLDAANDTSFETQHRMHDDAWVNYRFNQFGWIEDSKALYLLSEESGYSHLYVKPIDGKLKQITSGNYVVDTVKVSKDGTHAYYKANKKHPGIFEVYQTELATGDTQALTDLNGMTDFVLSPDESLLVLTHSKLTMPPELYVKSVDSDTEAARLTNTISDAFLSIDWKAPSIVAVPSSHTEQPIYSRVYLPENLNAQKRRAVVFNHGAGYLQNAHLGWSAYFREFMFHNLLISQGYVVLDMDFRASAGYGRDWRTAIYRQMGTPEVQDLKDGVNWLVDNANVDRNRIGTYGGSYGGFLTFMALFNEPDLFQAGAALRPVSDWAHYNLPYTSNILNTPDVDPLAYERSSPIYFAEGLNKPLLMNAPMVDDNVFFVDVVRLVQRLIELEKEDFETAIYPVEPHGFVQPSSWLDEYRRIHKLFETHL